MSLQALLWVKNDAPVTKINHLAVLYALADHASEDGTGAWPSQARIAYGARCDVRTVRRHLKELENQGLITRGDQKLVSHFPVDRRPVVYDLNMVLKRDMSFEEFADLDRQKRADDRDRQKARRDKKATVPTTPTDAVVVSDAPTVGQIDLPEKGLNVPTTERTVGQVQRTRGDKYDGRGRTVVSYKPSFNNLPKEPTNVRFSESAPKTDQIIDAEIVETEPTQTELVHVDAPAVIAEPTTKPTKARHAYTKEFEQWWKIFPKRVAKLKAFQAWEKVIADPTLPGADELIAHAQHYAQFCQATNREQQYTLLPTTWLNGHRWNDELVISANTRLSRDTLDRAYMQHLAQAGQPVATQGTGMALPTTVPVVQPAQLTQYAPTIAAW